VTARRRLDVELVRRGISESRTDAQRLIDEHRVFVNGAVAEKSSRQIAPSDQLVLAGPRAQFVGRGGLKLEHALDQFAIDVSDMDVLDAGASTGGFTDCLLQHGAATVTAVDVGHGQLHERLRADRRVINHERTNIRHIVANDFETDFDMAVGDLSFISLRLVIAPLVSVCKPGAEMVLLVKPQFEAGRAEVNKGRGIISDSEVRQRVCAEIDVALAAHNCETIGWTESPIRGAEGNVEFLVHAVAPGRSS
jgi:23S rRNA (cytidine1920-2'-O)/16S rRNA (cytidine1409-2'-O)-methyltransferase